jgi:hypothetical protein
MKSSPKKDKKRHGLTQLDGQMRDAMTAATNTSDNKPVLHLTAKVPAYNPGTFRVEKFNSPFATDEEALKELRKRLANRGLRTNPSAKHLVRLIDNCPSHKLADIWRLLLHRYAAEIL